MDKKQFKDLLDSTHKSLVNLTATKGDEYSRDTDQLANFKRQAEELFMTPEKVLMVYLNKHLDAIKSYVKTQVVLSEPIEGRIDDAILYLILLKGIVADGRSQLNVPNGMPPSVRIHSSPLQYPNGGNVPLGTVDIRPQFELK